jgi:hypothetical protein
VIAAHDRLAGVFERARAEKRAALISSPAIRMRKQPPR